MSGQAEFFNTSPNQRLAIQFASNSYNLYGAQFGEGILNALVGDTSVPDDPQSNTHKAGLIKHPHPVSVSNVYALKDISGHHSSCIQAKKYTTVGLGFIDDGDSVSKAKTDEEAIEQTQSLLSGQGRVESKVDVSLDPFTNFGFMNELLDACEDFMDVGTGYLEVHRDASNNIDGITQIPAKDLWFCTYNRKIFFQYQYQATGNLIGGSTGGTTKYWALFGKGNREWLLSPDGPFTGSSLKKEDISEIIPFIQPSNRVKYYGYPDWISASVDIDLLKKSKQYKADFYHNRGVLDKILVVTGEAVDIDAWKRIEDSIKSSIGGGNNFSSMAMNFANEKVAVDIKNMGADGKTEEQFAKDMETLTQNIVSAHGVPPLLANILIPGKLGASNEFINALIGFQLLRINSYQNVFEKMLAKTLGSDWGIAELNPEDFRLRTITSQIDIASMDTVGRMRSEATDPANEDRDLGDGVKNLSKWRPGDRETGTK